MNRIACYGKTPDLLGKIIRSKLQVKGILTPLQQLLRDGMGLPVQIIGSVHCVDQGNGSDNCYYQHDYIQFSEGYSPFTDY